MRWFDAHLDLASLAACGRDMHAEDLGRCGGPPQPAAVTLPSLASGGVTHALATVFIEPDGKDAPIAYPTGDADAAHRAALRQLDIYATWAREGRLTPLRSRHMKPPPERTAPPARDSAAHARTRIAALCAGVLIEGADAIPSPADLAWWVERGVVAIGLAWAKESRYAGGNMTDLPLTSLGREMVRAMDRLGVVHDASHLCDRSLDQLFEATEKPIIASHSNSRAIVSREALTLAGLPPGVTAIEPRVLFQRHVTDAAIREIARRGGVVGVNLYSPFLIPGGDRTRRATLDQWFAHVDHVCQLLGHHRAIGLGSDMDGGFGADALPEHVNTPSDLTRLAEQLARRRWSDDAIHAFAFGNWAAFWGVADTR